MALAKGPCCIVRSPLQDPEEEERSITTDVQKAIGRSVMVRSSIDVDTLVPLIGGPLDNMNKPVRQPPADSAPPEMLKGIELDATLGIPVPKIGAVIMSIPTIQQSSMPDHVYKVDVNDPALRPYLPDMTGGQIDLSGRGPTTRQIVAVERYPTLPFWPGTYNRRNVMSQMSPIEAFIRAWRPKQIPTWALSDSAFWQQLPFPAPVFVLIPHFGTGVALYYRFGNAISRPILYYAVRKLTPLPVSANSEYVGPIWEVFASWCKPIKYAVGRLILPDMQNPTGAVKVMKDDGGEFTMDFDTLKNSDYPPLVVARNALRRDTPELDATLALQSHAPPMAVLKQMERNAIARAGSQGIMDGSNMIDPRSGRVVQRPTPPDSKDDDDDDDDNKKSKPARAPGRTQAARSAIGAMLHYDKILCGLELSSHPPPQRVQHEMAWHAERRTLQPAVAAVPVAASPAPVTQSTGTAIVRTAHLMDANFGPV